MRVLVLAHGRLSPEGAKTGNSLIKYARDGWSAQYAGHPGPTGVPVASAIVGVLDAEHADADAGDHLGEHARGIPVLGSVTDALHLRPDALAIGVAPVGGRLPDAWRQDVVGALENGLDVVSGLHTFLGNDPEFAQAAKGSGGNLIDVRRPDASRYRIATGEAGQIDAVIVALAGTDCGSGKMTAAIELTRESRARGIDAAFVATGQTGLMVGADAGSPLDATVSDFVSGVVEGDVLQAASSGAQLIFVEGQGSLRHPAYGGVTCSLLHGAFPDVLVVADEPRREHLGFPSAVPFPKPDVKREIELAEAMLSDTTAPRVAAVSLITRGLDADAALRMREEVEASTGRVAGDVFRGETGRLLDAVLDAATKRGVWDGKRAVPGARAERFPAAAHR